MAAAAAVVFHKRERTLSTLLEVYDIFTAFTGRDNVLSLFMLMGCGAVSRNLSSTVAVEFCARSLKGFHASMAQTYAPKLLCLELILGASAERKSYTAAWDSHHARENKEKMGENDDDADSNQLSHKKRLRQGTLRQMLDEWLSVIGFAATGQIVEFLSNMPEEQRYKQCITDHHSVFRLSQLMTAVASDAEVIPHPCIRDLLHSFQQQLCQHGHNIFSNCHIPLLLDNAELCFVAGEPDAAQREYAKALRIVDQRNIINVKSDILLPSWLLSSSEIKARNELLRERSCAASRGPNSLSEVTIILQQIGLVCESTGRFLEAIQVYERAVACFELGGLLGHPCAVACMIHLARCYYVTHDMGTARLYAQSAKDTFLQYHFLENHSALLAIGGGGVELHAGGKSPSVPFILWRAIGHILNMIEQDSWQSGMYLSPYISANPTWASMYC